MSDDTLRAGVGPLIRARRQEMELSLQELADRVGCAKSYMSSIETERRNPPGEEMLVKLEEVLMLPAGKLVGAARWQRSLAAGGPEVREEVARLHSDQKL